MQKLLITLGIGIAVIALGELASRTIFAKDATEDYKNKIKDLDNVMADFVSDDENNGMSYFQMMAHHEIFHFQIFLIYHIRD